MSQSRNAFKLKVKIRKISKMADFKFPEYKTNGSAGMDLRADIEKEMVLKRNKFLLVPTGISMSIPEEYEGQVRSRSGLSAKHGIFVLNAPGTIDSDYRGEIKVILANMGDSDYVIKPRERIAQFVLARYRKVEWDLEWDEKDETERGENGFGSTGKQ